MLAHHRSAAARANAFLLVMLLTCVPCTQFIPFKPSQRASLLGSSVTASACMRFSFLQELNGKGANDVFKTCSYNCTISSRTESKFSLMLNVFLQCFLSLIFPIPSMLAAMLRALSIGSACAGGNGLLAV